MGVGAQNGRFPSKIALRLKKVCYRVSLCEKCQRQSCKAFIGLTIRVNMIGGEDPLYLKFWVKLTAVKRNRRFSIYFCPSRRPRWPRMMNGVIAFFSIKSDSLSVVEDRPIMSVTYCLPVPVFHLWPKLTHSAARSLCDSWAICLLLLVWTTGATLYRVGQLKWGQLTFLMVTFECIGKIQWFFAHVNYIQQEVV